MYQNSLFLAGVNTPTNLCACGCCSNLEGTWDHAALIVAEDSMEPPLQNCKNSEFSNIFENSEFLQLVPKMYLYLAI